VKLPKLPSAIASRDENGIKVRFGEGAGFFGEDMFARTQGADSVGSLVGAARRTERNQNNLGIGQGAHPARNIRERDWPPPSLLPPPLLLLPVATPPVATPGV
jgi:hypothetical protein